MEKTIENNNMSVPQGVTTSTFETSTPLYNYFNKPIVFQRESKSLSSFIIFLGKIIASGVICAIILNAVSSSVWPELPEEIPVFYEFCNGFLVIIEFLIRVIFSTFASIFNGCFFKVAKSNLHEFITLLDSFFTWASSLTF